MHPQQWQPGEYGTPRCAASWVYVHILLGALQLAIYLMSWCRIACQDIVYALGWKWNSNRALRIPQHMGVVLPGQSPSHLLRSALTCILSAMHLCVERHDVSATSMHQLSVYDRHGVLAQHVRELMLDVEEAVRLQPPASRRAIKFYLGGKRIPTGMPNLWMEGEDVPLDDEDTLVNDARPPSPTVTGDDVTPTADKANSSMSPLFINILQESDGKSAMLALLSDDLLTHAPPMDVATAAARMLKSPSTSPMSQAPEILVIFEGHATRGMLHAYPPWDLAQAELFFIPGDGRPRPWHLQQVCEQFAGIQQRHGQ
jgi:hypothetical protein